MGCCGGRSCCADSPDAQGGAVRRNSHVSSAGSQSTRWAPGALGCIARDSTAEPNGIRADHRSEASVAAEQESVVPVVTSHNVPYGDPAGDGVHKKPSDETATVLAEAGTPSAHSTRSATSTSTGKHAEMGSQMPAAEATAAQRQPRADPEQGGPMQGLPPPVCPAPSVVGSATAKKASNMKLTGAPGKQGSLWTRFKQRLKPSAPTTPAAAASRVQGSKSAGHARPTRKQPSVGRFGQAAPSGGRTGGSGDKGRHVPCTSAGAPLVTRKPTGPQRTARPVIVSAATAQKTLPIRSGASSRHVPPQERAAVPVRKPNQLPVLSMGSTGSLQGSTSAEETSPGHSPLPEYAPSRHLVAPAGASWVTELQGAPPRRSLAGPAVRWLSGQPAQGVYTAGGWTGLPTSGETVGEGCSEECASRRGWSEDSDFGPGGFCRVSRGDIVGCFKVAELLGDGGYGAVWLATHLHSGGEAVVKICRSAAVFHRAAQVEVDMLTEIDAFARKTRSPTLSGFRSRIVQLYSSYTHPGRDGAGHPCLALEALGPDLAELSERHNDQGVAAPIVKVIMQQLLQALQFLSAMHVTHGDIKPDNILLTSSCRIGAVDSDGMTDLGQARLHGDYLPPKRTQTLAQCLLKQYAIKVVDFGKATHRGQRTSGMLQTIEYRAPEVVNGAQVVSPAVDIWSAGCTCFEMLTGKYLFDVGDPRHNELGLHIDLWVLWIATLGSPPRSFTRPGTYPYVHMFFDHRGKLLKPTQPGKRTLRQRLEEKAVTRNASLASLHDFLSSMIKYIPGSRVLPQRALQHRWLKV